MADDQDIMMTASEAATALGLSPSRVYHLIRDGRLPATKYGTRWRIARSDLDLVRERNPTGWPRGRTRRPPDQKWEIDGEPAIDLREAGRRLGISRVRVLKLIHDDRLPATKRGNRWLVKVNDLQLVRDRPPGRPRSSN